MRNLSVSPCAPRRLSGRRAWRRLGLGRLPVPPALAPRIAGRLLVRQPDGPQRLLRAARGVHLRHGRLAKDQVLVRVGVRVRVGVGVRVRVRVRRW